MKILNLKSTTHISKIKNSCEEKKAVDTIFTPANKEWYNTIYHYNNKNSISIPIINNIIEKLITNFFNMYNNIEERKVKLPNLRKKSRINSGNKIWISKIEVKHNNDLAIINLYLYNRKVSLLKNKLKIIYKNLYKKSSFNLDKDLSSNKFINITNLFKNKINNFYNIILREKTIYNDIIANNIIKHNITNVFSKYLKKTLKKELLIMYYKQYISLYTFKYKNLYLLPLKKLIGKIYKKRIIFNVISLKNYFLDSNIMSQIVATKATKRNNKIVSLLKRTLIKVNTPTFSRNLISKESKILNIKKNLLIKNNKELISLSKNMDNLLYENFKDTQNIISTIKNKVVTGVRIEASGRLTKRFTAQRSVFKLRYKGTLKDIESSYKGLPNKFIRNNIKSNIQYTKINSKNRIGAFGIKGWINSI